MFLSEDAFDLDGADEGPSDRPARPPTSGRRAAAPPRAPPADPSRRAAGTSSLGTRPGSARTVGSFSSAAAPRPPPGASTASRSRPGTGVSTSRHESPATFHEDLFGDEEPARAPPTAQRVSAAEKAKKARQLAAQKRRERQMHSGVVAQNEPPTGPAGFTAAAPGGFSRPRPPSQPAQPRTMYGGFPGAGVGGAGGGVPRDRAGGDHRDAPASFQQNAFAPSTGNSMGGPGPGPPSREPPSSPRRHASGIAPRGTGGFMRSPTSGENTRSSGGSPGDDRVHAFDEEDLIETIPMESPKRRGTGIGGPTSSASSRSGRALSPGAEALARDLDAQGLSDEYDPTGGVHPRELEKRRERERELAEAEKLGGRARRLANRPRPAKVDTRDKRMFLTAPGPRSGPVQCHIIRRKGGGGGVFSKLGGSRYPEYFLYLDAPGTKPGEPSEKAEFLLSARKRKKSKSSNYVISLDEEDLARQSGNYFGKLRSNFVGSEFTIYDKGAKPGEKHFGEGSAQMPERTELGAVTYEYNVLGTRGPRKMSAAIPRVDPGSGQRAVFRPIDAKGTEGVLDTAKKGMKEDLIVLKNKSPKWNEQMQAYCLNFAGRVTHASVKNFQLVDEDDEREDVLLQFGKVGKDVFTMDYAYPMSALQAFAICLTSFDNKLACE